MSIEVLKGKVYLGTATPEKGGQTINNEDITVTQNGEYSASAGYTGLGTVMVNVPQGDIVTATNTTGAAISSGDKVWLEKVSGGWNLVDFTTKVPAYSVTGYPTITAGGVASNFSETNSIYRSQTIDFSKPWTFRTHIKTGSDVGGNQFLYAGPYSEENGKNSSGLVLWLSNNLLVADFFTGNSSSYTSNASLTVIPTAALIGNTEYYIECGWTGTEYFARYSTDGQTWIEESPRVSSTTPCNQWRSQFVLGHLNWISSMYFKGSIYLFDTAMIVGGSTVWAPYAIQIFGVDNIFSGIANEAIANNATGEVKTVQY